MLPCPAWTGTTGAPDSVWVTIEESGSFTPDTAAFPWYTFEISTDLDPGLYEVRLNAACLPDRTQSPQVDVSVSGGFVPTLGGHVFDAVSHLTRRSLAYMVWKGQR